MSTRYARLAILGLSLAVMFAFGSLAHGGEQPGGKGSESRGDAQKVIREGIAVEFSVEPAAGGQERSAGLREGEQYRVSDLLYAALIQSANDAANVLAEAVAGSQNEFIRMIPGAAN